MASLCFFYNAIPWLRLNVGFVITPDRVAFVVLVIGFVSSRLTGSRVRLERLPAATLVATAIAAFTAAALTSWVVTGSDAASTKFGNLIWIANSSLYPALAFFIARRLRYDRTLLKQLLVFFAALGIYLSATAFAEHYEISFLVFPNYILDSTIGTHFGRSRGPFVNTIANGGMLVLAFIAWSALAATLTGVKRLGALFACIFVVGAVYFTETRSVWLSLTAVTSMMLVLRTSHRRTALFVIAVLACVFVLGVGSKFSAFDATLFSRRQVTIDYRLDNYAFAWNAFKENPVSGLGYGRFQYQWRLYADLENSRLGRGLDDGNHNTFLGILADLGLLGAVPFLLMIVGAGLVCWGAYRRLGDPRTAFERRFVMVASAILGTYVILGITSDLKAVPIVNIATFWLVGVAASLASSSRNSPSPRVRPSAATTPRANGRFRRPRAAGV